MRYGVESHMETKLDAFLRAVDEGDASPDVEDFNQEAFIEELKNDWSNVSGSDFVDETAKLAVLRKALIEGEESGIAEDFDPEIFIAKLNES